MAYQCNMEYSNFTFGFWNYTCFGKRLLANIYCSGINDVGKCSKVIRGQVLAIREMEYIQAAKALGLKNMRIIIRHILPNVFGPVIVIAASNFASAIIIEAGLSFLGVGVQPPAELGTYDKREL